MMMSVGPVIATNPGMAAFIKDPGAGGVSKYRIEAWDGGGFPLIFDPNEGRLVRAQDLSDDGVTYFGKDS
jgi:hypothetical protein